MLLIDSLRKEEVSGVFFTSDTHFIINYLFCALEEKSSKDTSLIAGTPEMAISSEASNLEERSSTIPEMGVEPSGSKYEAPNSNEKGEDIVSSAIK